MELAPWESIAKFQIFRMSVDKRPSQTSLYYEPPPIPKFDWVENMFFVSGTSFVRTAKADADEKNKAKNRMS